MEYMGVFIFFCGLLSVFIYKKFLLSLFIGMEVVMLGLIALCVAINFFYVSSLMLVLCLAVCEASVCLALIVSIMRRVGNDSVSSMSSF